MTRRPRAVLLAGALAAVGAMLPGCAQTTEPDHRPRASAMTIHESGTLLSECLADDGWTAVVDSDGGVISEYPPEQESSYSEALRRCLDEVGVGAPIDYSPEQYEALYESAVESQKCLDREFGLQTPEAPSLATFIEAQGAWSPFNQLPDMSAEDFLAIQQRCPQPTL